MSGIRAALMAHEKEAVDRLVGLMQSADKDSTRLEACKVILAYLYGKPDAVQVEDLSDQELLDLVMRRKARREAERGARGLE